MNSIRFSIKVCAIDSYIYSGHLFLILESGEIVYIEVSKIMRKLVAEYPKFENLIRLAFQRNDYFSNRQGLMILGVGEIKKVLTKLWSRASEEVVFEIDFDIDDFVVISEIPSMPVLDMRLYAMRMYIGCKGGLYEINLNADDRYSLIHLNPKKDLTRK